MKKVVIIGGGFAGSCVAKKLEDKYDITLIDSKDYFEFTPSVLRTLVEPLHVRKIQILHKKYLSKAKTILGQVTNITNTEVFVGKKTFPFDFLVISSGSSYSLPIKQKNVVIASRGNTLSLHAKKLQNANEILIIGGGLVGVELAAEIIIMFPDKKITIIHSHPELLERMGEKARKFAKRFLEKRNVRLLLNEKYVHESKNKLKNTFITNKNTQITPDLTFMCTGIKPHSDFLKKHFSDSLNKKGFVKVNHNLEVIGFKNIFAAGDVTDILEEKTAQNAELQAKIVVQNILNSDKKKKRIQYISTPRLMVLSLGKKCGILTYKNIVITGIIPGIMKSIIEWIEMRKYK